MDIPNEVAWNARTDVIYSRIAYNVRDGVREAETGACWERQVNDVHDSLTFLWTDTAVTEDTGSFGYLATRPDGAMVLAFTGTDFGDRRSVQNTINFERVGELLAVGAQANVELGTPGSGVMYSQVHPGVVKAFRDVLGHVGTSPTLGRVTLLQAFEQAMTSAPGTAAVPRRDLVVAGHSLGGAIGAIAALDLLHRYGDQLRVKLVTIGAYRVLGSTDASRVQEDIVHHSGISGEAWPPPGKLSVQRWVNAGDPIPSVVPSAVLGYSHFGHAMHAVTNGEYGQRGVDWTPYHAVFSGLSSHGSNVYLERLQPGMNQCDPQPELGKLA